MVTSGRGKKFLLKYFYHSHLRRNNLLFSFFSKPTKTKVIVNYNYFFSGTITLKKKQMYSSGTSILVQLYYSGQIPEFVIIKVMRKFNFIGSFTGVVVGESCYYWNCCESSDIFAEIFSFKKHIAASFRTSYCLLSTHPCLEGILRHPGLMSFSLLADIIVLLSLCITSRSQLLFLIYLLLASR